MKYEANPVIVDASKIVEVLEAMPRGHVGLKLEGDGWHLAAPEQMARMKPQVGDYVVMQSDGYIYLNPKDVFERKYSPAAANGKASKSVPMAEEATAPVSVGGTGQ